MSPNVFNKYIKAHEEKIKEQDALNWLAGKYIAIGVNNPKKYPPKPLLDRERVESANRIMTGEEMDRRIRVINRMLGGKVK